MVHKINTYIHNYLQAKQISKKLRVRFAVGYFKHKMQSSFGRHPLRMKYKKNISS
jgi:carboxypeptidase C (cathepsin A)